MKEKYELYSESNRIFLINVCNLWNERDFHKIAGTLISILYKKKNQITIFPRWKSNVVQQSFDPFNDDKLSSAAFLMILSMSLYLFLF